MNEQSSYSAMLNIAEPVPSTESVPPILGTRSSLYIRDLLDTDRVPPILRIPEMGFGRNYSEFRNCKQFSEFRNRTEFVGIPWNFGQFRLHSIPGIPYRNNLLIPEITLEPQ